MTEDQARQFLGQWRNLYRGVTTALEDAQKVAEDRGYVKLWPTGRRRHFDGGFAAGENPKDAMSSIVQGGVGEFIKQLMMELREPALRAGCKLVLNCHDSLLWEVPNERGMEERWTNFVRRMAERSNPFSIAMPIGMKIWS
jgi:DNA polymerase I-like protein with 3'-5' exonuclease and polymerase domains